MKLKNQIGVVLVYTISCIQTYNVIYYKGCQWELKDPLINKNIWNEDLCHPIGISSSNYLYSALVCKSLVCTDETVKRWQKLKCFPWNFWFVFNLTD